MKQKKTTYLLGVAVLIIWGIIVFRVINASEDGAVFISSTKSTSNPALNDYAVKIDTAKLELNYRDPFKTSQLPDTLRNNAPIRPTITMALKKKVEIDWSFIRYSGYVANLGQRKVFSLIIVRGKSFMLAEGERFEDIKLIKNMRDSIKISFNHQTKTIIRSSGS